MKNLFLSVQTLVPTVNLWMAMLVISGEPLSPLDAVARPLAAIVSVWVAIAVLRQKEGA